MRRCEASTLTAPSLTPSTTTVRAGRPCQPPPPRGERGAGLDSAPFPRYRKSTAAEAGTHEELMQRNGLYRRLNEVQIEDEPRWRLLREQRQWLMADN